MKKGISRLLLVAALTALIGVDGAEAGEDGSAATVVLECERFSERGGWFVDSQFIGEMGSSYLLAHGLGKPVADAKSSFKIEKEGTYLVWVRTKDWTAKWRKPNDANYRAAGRFQLIVNGRPLPVTLGEQGQGEWLWTKAGEVALKQGENKVALHDLSGFDARCDAICFTTGEGEVEKKGGGGQRSLFSTNSPLSSVNCHLADLTVVGGGIAGICTAISAARLGLKVALVQDRPILGGANSSEVRVHLGGFQNLGPYPRLGDVVSEIGPAKGGNAQPAAQYEDDRKLAAVKAEKNITLFLNTRVGEVEKWNGGKVEKWSGGEVEKWSGGKVEKWSGGEVEKWSGGEVEKWNDGKVEKWNGGEVGKLRIHSVVGRDVVSGKCTRFVSPLFVDCTGDGTVGYLAGADYRIGRESKAETGEEMAVDVADKMTMGASVQWYAKSGGEVKKWSGGEVEKWSGGEVEKWSGGEVEKRSDLHDFTSSRLHDFTSSRLHDFTSSHLHDFTFPHEGWMIPFNESNCEYNMRGDWDWETGMNRDQLGDFETVRDYGLLVVYSNWSFIKNFGKRKAEFADAELSWVAHVAGKRETRRLLGDHILCQQDVFEERPHPDGTCCTTWSIDLHTPMPANVRNYTGEPFRSVCTHAPHYAYPIPYRCFYSRNVANLFMAGRDISVTHVALGTTRVMRTHGMQGEVVGMAASICKKHGCDPRGVYEKHLDELKALMTKGVGLKNGEPHPPQDYNQGGIQMHLTVDGVLPAGNVVVDRIEGDTVYLHPDLRDTAREWIYWKFRVMGAEGRTLHFRFSKPNTVGSRSAAVSLDHGRTWRWADEVQPAKTREPKTGNHPDWRGFDWTFGKWDHEVWFCQTIPYNLADWRAFLSRHEPRTSNPELRTSNLEPGTLNLKLFETGILCKSRKGRDIPYARFGRLDGQARERIFLSSRHHCQEATATFVLEGLLEQVFANDDLGRWLRENVEFRVVPFVDFDGVVDGDQGKGRKPHDHARDYNEDRPVLYPEVRAIMAMLREWKPTVVNDFHCPWLRGSWFQENNSNEFIYQVGLDHAENWVRQKAFGSVLERVQTAGAGYRQSDDYWYGRGWNAGANYTQGKPLIAWAVTAFPEARLVTTFEIPFANARSKTLHPADFRAFGRDVAAAYREFLKCGRAVHVPAHAP